MFSPENPEGVFIFRCENGYGLELVTSHGNEDMNPENYSVKRYVAKSLEEVLSMVSTYFRNEDII